MRVLLVNPTQQNVYGRGVPPPYPPLGLLYIASSLHELDCEVDLVDWDADGFSPGSFSQHLNGYDPQLVGLTATTPQIGSALALARLVKEASNARVVVGGSHASALPEETVAHRWVDFVVVGEGEETIKELLLALDKEEYGTIRGLWYKEHGEPRGNPIRAPVESLDALPFPARHLLRNPRRYSPPEGGLARWVSLISSRGCPERCTFCATPRLFGRKLRRRSVESVLAEIEEGVRTFGAREVHIADDCFTSDREWIVRFCSALARLGRRLSLYFLNGLRADQVDYDLLSALRGVGLRNVGFGVESGNQGILNRCRKGFSLERVRESFRVSKSLSLSTWGFFVLGLPGETVKTVQDTMDFALELEPDYAKFFTLVPYPGTRLWDEFSKNGLITDYEYSHWGLYSKPVFRLPTMDEGELERLLLLAYRRFYLRPKKLLHHLRFRSLTELRLKLRGLRFLKKFLLP